MATSVLTFQDTTFDLTDVHGMPWLRLPQIGVALGYENPYHAQKVYDRNAAEFTNDMTQVVDLPTAGGVQPVRIFSLRGAHLLGMLARTERAAAFRRWVLDVLEGRDAPVAVGPMTHGMRLAYLRERRLLLRTLATTRDPATGRELHQNLRTVSGLLHLRAEPLEALAPALRQMALPGTGVAQ